MVPKVQVLVTVRLTLRYPGEVPKFRGISASPGAGVTSKLPNDVQTMLAGFAGPLHATPGGAKAGRSLKIPSPFTSAPVMILNGRPEAARMNGFRLTPHHGVVHVPPKEN